MSKRQSDQLFTLIRSLGKAEKRHFKIYSSKHVIGTENIYVRLFDAIEKQGEYDERALRSDKLFHDFPSLKKRLYRSVLRSLEVFHSSTGIEIRSIRDQVEILFGKSLYVHCSRLIRKAKKVIAQYELFEEWLEFLKWEYRIAVKNFDMPVRMQVLREEKEVLALLNNQKKYRDLANLFSLRYQQYGSERGRKGMSEMERHLSSLALKEIRHARSIRARQNFYDCHYLFSLIREDYKSSYRFSKKMADMYLDNPLIISFNAASYLTSINNLLIACNGIHNYAEMLGYLEKLEQTRKA